MFRSIDSGSVKGFPKDVKEAEAKVELRDLYVVISFRHFSLAKMRTRLG